MATPTPASQPEWLDEWLRPLLRGQQKLPLLAAERSHAQQHRRLQLIVLGAVLAMIAVFGALMFGIGGAPPGLIAGVVLALPVGTGLLLYGVLYFTLVRGRRDDGDHPWKIYIDARGMSLERADGSRIGAPWKDWRYQGYIYGTIKFQRLVKALDLSLDGAQLRIDLIRYPRQRQLARAILQGLAGSARA